MGTRLRACAAAAALLALSCKGSAGYPLNFAAKQGEQVASPHASASGTMPPPVELRAPDASLRVADPEARAMFEAAGAPSATLAPPRSPSRVLVTALENTAAGEAHGAKPVTDLLGSTLPEGGRASTTLTLPIGSCTTFVAQGGLGVIEADLFLSDLNDTTSTPVILAADPDGGPIAVIGGAAAGCFNAPFDLPVRLTVQVRRGAGPVLVRAFALDR